MGWVEMAGTELAQAEWVQACRSSLPPGARLFFPAQLEQGREMRLSNMINLIGFLEEQGLWDWNF